MEQEICRSQGSMSLAVAIAKLVRGSAARDVVEGLDGTAMHYAALMVRYGVPEAEAVKRSVKLIGHAPDEEVLSMALHSLENRKKKSVSYWDRQGHYDPKRTPLFLDPAGNSLDD